MADSHRTTTVFAMLCVLFQPAHATLARVTPPQGSEQAATALGGTIVGIVVNERQEPVGRARVHAFGVHAPPETPDAERFAGRASSSASTGADGWFQMSGLEPGQYVIAADAVPFRPPGPEPAMYGTTFYPSTLDAQEAGRVSVARNTAATIQVALVRVSGVRLSGSVVSPSGQPVHSMPVTLYRQFGGFGSGARVDVVGADGTFEIPRVTPGWYHVTIGTRPSGYTDDGREFADQLVEVRDQDVDGLTLVLGRGASIMGRIVVDDSLTVPTLIGLRVTASPIPELSVRSYIAARVVADGTFRMSGLSGAYQFAVTADRPPRVVATRIAVDGVETAGTEAQVTGAAHDIVLYIGPAEPPTPTADVTLQRFKNETLFSRQFDIAEILAERQDPSVLPSLADWLSHEDRHIRGNVAFVFGRLGDARGFEVIRAILSDRSDRPGGQGIPMAPGNGRYQVAAQIKADRYYAAWLLGHLRDPRAVPVLVALLKDPEIDAIVPWSLGQVGDRRAIDPLLSLLDEASPSMVVRAIHGLELLQAREALPRLRSLLNDHRRAHVGSTSVAEAAAATIARLQ